MASAKLAKSTVTKAKSHLQDKAKRLLSKLEEKSDGRKSRSNFCDEYHRVSHNERDSAF